MDVSHFNIVDILIIIIVVSMALGAAQRGFILSVAQTLAGIGALLAAIFFNDIATQMLIARFELPQAGAAIIAFIAVWIIAQILLNLFVQSLVPLQRAIRSTPLFGQLDAVLSAILGGVRGLFYAFILILPFALTPFVPSVTNLVRSSVIGGEMTTLARSAFVILDPIFGEALKSGLSVLPPPQQEQEYTDLGFKVTEGLEVDEAAETQMLDLLNQERSKAGLPPLVMDPQLRDIARAHSREMFMLGYFSHNSPVNGTPVDRFNKAGITYITMGENLAYAPNLQVAHEGLMNSPGHRANILSPDFGRVGIGVITSPNRGMMFTQDFRN